MIILFRSCEANLSPGSMQNDKTNKPRWNNKYKLEILRKCYKSIQSGLTPSDHIIIIDDRTSPETLEWMRNNTVAKFSIQPVLSLDETRKAHKYPLYHYSQANSCTDLMEFLIYTAERTDEVIYMCEDDYLHTHLAISNMKAIFATGYQGFYVPYDYPDRYTIDINRTCEIHAGPYGHLRTVPSATLTLAAPAKTWLHFKYDLLRAGVFAEDSWTWKAFQQGKCLSPIPSNATHLQDGCISPYVDWEILYESINIT